MSRKIIMLLSITIILISCLTINGGYQLFRKSLKLYSDGMITGEQYDSVMGKFYTIDTSMFVYDSRIKTKGCYITADPEIDIDNEMKKNENYNEQEKENILNSYKASNEQRYRIIKFSNNGLALKSGGFGVLTNNAILEAYGTGRFRDRYKTINNNLMYEYLQHRDFEIHNIVQTATISESGDTLIFYKIENLGSPKDRKPQSKKLYIYYDTLTAIPIDTK